MFVLVFITCFPSSPGQKQCLKKDTKKSLGQKFLEACKNQELTGGCDEQHPMHFCANNLVSIKDEIEDMHFAFGHWLMQ